MKYLEIRTINGEEEDCKMLICVADLSSIAEANLSEDEIPPMAKSIVSLGNGDTYWAMDSYEHLATQLKAME